MNIYPLDNYDKYFALKVSLGTSVLLLFLSRGILVAIMSFYLKDKLTGVATLFYANDICLMVSLIVALPALVIIGAWLRRDPKASKFQKKIWSQGIFILAVSAIANIGLIIWSITIRPTILDADIIQLVFSLYCLLYIFKSKRLRDTFDSFPEKIDEKNTNR